MKENFNTWEGIFQSFQEASAEVTGAGFNGETWRSRTIKTAEDCLAALNSGTPIPAFHKQRSTSLPPVVAMLLKEKTQIDILDFGGGLGIGYMTLAESIPQYSGKINYTIVEVPQICDAGRQIFSGKNISYVDTIPDKNKFDLIHSASAIQYVEDWPGLLRKFNDCEPDYLFLSDVFTGNIPTFVTLQNYYGSKIAHWFFNQDELLSYISSLGYELIMKSFVSSRRLDAEDILPMGNFPEDNRLDLTVHLLFKRIK